MGTYELLWSASKNKKRPSVPDRDSSAVCWYWTDLDRVTASHPSAEQDPYLEALKQLSATHRPSLDDLPLHRSVAINEPKSTLSGKAPRKDAHTSLEGDHPDAASGSKPRITGQRYHRLANGLVYAEFVDPLALDHHGHSPETKPPPHPRILHPPDAGYSHISKVGPLAHIPPFHYPADIATNPPPSPTTTPTPLHPDAHHSQEPEGREARRSRWLHWHISKHHLPPPQQQQPHSIDGTADLPASNERDAADARPDYHYRPSADTTTTTTQRRSRNLTESTGADAIYRDWSAPGFHGPLSARGVGGQGAGVVGSGCRAEHVLLAPGRGVREGGDGVVVGERLEGVKGRLRERLLLRPAGVWKLRRRDAWRVEGRRREEGR